MLRASAALLLACALPCVAAPAASPEAAFDDYILRTNTHDFDAVEPLVDERAVYWFRDDEHRGVAAVRASFDATWAIVKDERYSVHDVHWLARDGRTAVVLYGYCWAGLVEGKPRSGGGRGTNVLVNRGGVWRIAHEHLTPYNAAQATRCAPTTAASGSGDAKTADAAANRSRDTP